MSYIKDMALNVKNANDELLILSYNEKNELLECIAKSISKSKQKILLANQMDIENAKASNMPDVMLDRLLITDLSIDNIISGVYKVISLRDPIGEILSESTLDNGLVLRKQRVPIGVIGIIYESRPNVTVDATVLCIKSSNSVILKGGKEAINTNIAFVDAIKKGITDYGINPNIINIVTDTSREVTIEMMKLNDIIDVLIPRGSANLINAVIDNATIPVIETGTGNCHVFIDESADIDMAIKILINAKTSRPSVCNACETLLIHKSISTNYLPLIKEVLIKHNVKILGCEKTLSILGSEISLASDEDFKKEFLDNIISIKIVDDVYAAVKHINLYSSSHSESIITTNNTNSEYFTKMVDSAVVYINASTRFTDGDEFGFGAEIGISTQKLHARGPMGLSELTSYKYIAYGNGQIR